MCAPVLTYPFIHASMVVFFQDFMFQTSLPTNDKMLPNGSLHIVGLKYSKSSMLCFLHYTKIEIQFLFSMVNQFSKVVLLLGTRQHYGTCLTWIKTVLLFSVQLSVMRSSQYLLSHAVTAVQTLATIRLTRWVGEKSISPLDSSKVILYRKL